MEVSTKHNNENNEQKVQEDKKRRAFLEALECFQRIYVPPKQQHLRKDENGEVFRYTTFNDLCRHIRPFLGHAGLSVRWGDCLLKNGVVDVTCVCAHREGEVTTSRVMLPFLRERGMSGVTGIMTVAKRYTLMAVLGLWMEETPSLQVAGEPERRSLSLPSGGHLGWKKGAKRNSNINSDKRRSHSVGHAGTSVIILHDSGSMRVNWEEEQEPGGRQYVKVVRLYQEKLAKFVSAGGSQDMLNRFQAFDDFIRYGEPGMEEIIRQGRRLTKLLAEMNTGKASTSTQRGAEG